MVSFIATSEELQPRIDRLALQGQDPEHTLVHAAEWLAADEPLKGLDAEGELAEGQRTLGSESSAA